MDRALFDDAAQQARLTGRPFRDALIQVAAEPKHYIRRAPIPWLSHLTPLRRARFLKLRHLLRADASMPPAQTDAVVTEAEWIMASWEFGDRPPALMTRCALRRDRLRKQWLAHPDATALRTRHAGSGIARRVMQTAMGLMVASYAWAGASAANSGCLSCNDMLLIFVANLLVPVALFSFFLQAPKKAQVA